MTSTATPIAQRRKFEEIAEHIELMIFSGRLSVGDKIPSERDLMARFGAGRSSVREAIFALQRKGLLTVRPGAAAKVSAPSADTLISELSGAVRHVLSRPEGIRDLQNARVLLEVGLARTAALLATDEDIAGLREALEANRAANDQETFARTDMLFHYRLAMISHNQIFTSMNMALNEWLAEQRKVSARAGATFEEIYRQHEAIFEAVAAHDPMTAQNAMESHLKTVAHYYWREVSRGLA